MQGSDRAAFWRSRLKRKKDLSDFVCDGDCENCPVNELDCDGNCGGCPCKDKCEDAEGKE